MLTPMSPNTFCAAKHKNTISQIAHQIRLQEKSFYIFIKDFVLDNEGWKTLNKLACKDNVYVLSGIIRDFLTGDFDGARDFDCVLLRGSIKDAEVLHYLRGSTYSFNSFGGLKIRRPHEVIDIWRISDTWGIRMQGLETTPESLIKSVFFNFSAIVYDFNNKRFIFDDCFCNFLLTKTMDVVYSENPNVPLCLVNILFYKQKYGYNMSLRLKRWIKKHYDSSIDFTDIQKRHFGYEIFDNDYIKKIFYILTKDTKMYKIDWDKYLSSKRYREKSEFDEHKKNDKDSDKRNAFESDFGRVAFSSALRRMHDKAQVMPLTTGDSVHTRLTHSIEVMSIAYSLGITLCRDSEFVDLYGQGKSIEYERMIPMVLKTAAFVHDIGNPPFGHFGETIIQNYFKEYLKKRIVTDKESLDFTCFDGNAEGFRILTRLQYIGDLSGLNLTYTTLAAYSKYPNDGCINKKYIGTKKHGVFTSESDILAKMADACNMRCANGCIKRHPLSFLVEAADSISYNVMDIEDGMTMGWYSFSDVTDFIDRYMVKKTNNPDFSILKTLGIDFKTEQISEKDEKRMMCDFRVKAIRYFVNLAITRFKDNIEDIDNGIYSKELIEDGDYVSSAFHEFAVKKIYPQREIEQIELTGYSVLNGLLDILLNCAFNPDKKFRNHLKSVISKTFLKVANREQAKDSPTVYKFFSNDDVVDLDIEVLNPYSKLRVIVDLISGMTDRYAVNVYQKLSGQRL